MAVHVTKKVVSKNSDVVLQDETDNMFGVTYAKKRKTSKAESELLQSNQIPIEERFQGEYFDAQDNKHGVVLRPPYEPQILQKLPYQNNALEPCIAAMEINIDGTGHQIENEDGEKVEEDDKDAATILEFFAEPFPGVSMITIRRKLRRDCENIGYGFFEITRSLNGDLMFMNYATASITRLLKLDAPIKITKIIKRFGREMPITMNVRERRFVQKVGNRSVFFKEYGASRELNKETGEWSEPGEKLDSSLRASELLYFMVTPDYLSPYGLPRWIAQTPSILGSRKAEELNLDFFNSGGLPPALIILQGGAMAAQTKKTLQAYLTGKGSNKHRAAIIETYSTGGDLNTGGNVKVSVERFGADRQKDSMFEKYDERSEKRIRSSFRLPPLFVGRTDDFTFATAHVAYTVAEAQVFGPERMEFDEIMNVTVVKELTDKYKFRSLPLNVKDAMTQLKGIELVKDAVNNESLVESVNEVANTNLVAKEDAKPEEVLPPGVNVIPINAQPKAVTTPPAATTPPGAVAQKSDPGYVLELAKDWIMVTKGQGKFEADDVTTMQKSIMQLEKSDRIIFDGYVALGLFSGFDHDPEGAIELCGCAAEIINKTDGNK